MKYIIIHMISDEPEDKLKTLTYKLKDGEVLNDTFEYDFLAFTAILQDGKEAEVNINKKEVRLYLVVEQEEKAEEEEEPEQTVIKLPRKVRRRK